ncbi:MAG: FAD-binding oxidoreductase, partial [Chloroflexaceae bacterium]|nr:FAD-binding oxidoreductase [Chloroflexaceae bacterium]
EGTLGIITEAQLRLIRNPPAVKTLMAAFDSVEAAGAAVSAIIAQGLVPATLEMMDQKIMRILEDFAHAGLPVEAGAGLIVEVDGYPQSVGPQIDAASEILLANGGFDLRVARSEEERAKIWLGRKSAAGAMARLAPAYYLVDGTVPRSKLAETLAGVNRICEAYDLRVGYVFHAGDGNLHPLILIPNPKDKAFVQRVIDAGRDILELCISHDGSITGEHGVGIEKRAFMPLMFSSTELAVMREIKTLFDPDGVLNPGKIFPEEESQTPIADRQSPIADRQSPISNLQSPQSPEEAAELLQACAAAGKTVRIRGGGSKSAHLPAADVTLSTGCMRGVKKLALEDLYVTVGAGTPLAELQAALAEHGMWVPLVSPWPEATLGGIVSTAFNGPLRMRYGGVRDLLLAATVVLADGRTIRAGRPVVKNVAGYDMPKLIAGAHGTLGLLCDVTLKLLPLPRASESLHVPLASLDDGLALAERLLRECLVGSALLLVQTGDRRPETGNGRPETGDRRPETGDRRPETGANERSITSSRQTALVYTAEGVVEDVAAELAQVQTALGSRESNASTEAGSDTWATWLRETTASGATVVRVGVPTRELPGLLRELAPTLRDASFVADMASGLLYTAGAAVEELRSAAVRRGGYAIVLQGAAGAAGTWGHTPGGLPLMRALKECWDGQGLLNPGAFVV